LGTFQKKMLRHCISATPLAVFLRATERARQRAVQSLPPNQRFHAALTM
jgi:putative transposase